MAEPNSKTPDVTLINHLGGGLIAQQGLPIHLCPSTLGTDRAGLVRRMNAMGASTIEMGRDGTLLIDLADVLAYPRESEDAETGEMRQYSWLVLIDQSGDTWGTSSPVVASKVSQLLALKSAGLLSWPVEMQIVTRTARNSGRRYHDIVLV